jgi:hypothetical protein
MKCIYCNNRSAKLHHPKDNEINKLKSLYSTYRDYFPYTHNRKDTLLRRKLDSYHCEHCSGDYLKVTDIHINKLTKEIDSENKFFIKTKEPCNARLFVS